MCSGGFSLSYLGHRVVGFKGQQQKRLLVYHVSDPPSRDFEAGKVQRLLELSQLDEARLVLVDRGELLLQLLLLVLRQVAQRHAQRWQGILRKKENY